MLFYKFELSTEKKETIIKDIFWIKPENIIKVVRHAKVAIVCCD